MLSWMEAAETAGSLLGGQLPGLWPTPTEDFI